MISPLEPTPTLLAAALAAIALAACSDADTGPPDPTPADRDEVTDARGDDAPDTGDAPETDAEHDLAERDDPRSDAADAPDSTDALGDTDAAQPPLPVCDPDERLVGQLCRQDFDRACYVDTECRPTERCVWRPTDNPTRPGTCVYTPPPPLVCPGAPTCPDAEGPLRVGMAARAYTPSGWELARPGWSQSPDELGFDRRFTGDVSDPRTFCDCGRDLVCPPTPEFEGCLSLGEWTGPDPDGTEGDGFMQGSWIAGFSNSRNAHLCPDRLLPPECEGPDCCSGRFAHDDIWARAVVLDAGANRIAWVTLDTIGFFYSDAQKAAAMLPEEWGVDWLVVASTHTHQAPDTVGQWGPGVLGAELPTDTGAIPEWMADVRDAIVGSVGDAVAALEPADVYAMQVDTGPVGFAVRDTRDPFVFDDRITALHFVRDGADPSDAGQSIGVVVNWHSHPEAVGASMIISSDFPHWVRQAVERGLPAAAEGFPARDGLGGVAMYASGSVGGLLNPLHRPVIARDGAEISANGFAKAEALGERLADLVLATFATPCEGPVPEDPELGCARKLDDESLTFAAAEMILDVTNVNFHAGGMGLKVFDRPIYNWRASDGNIGNVNMPKVLSSVTQIRLGDVVLQTFPGELFPEVFTGLRDGFVVRDPIRGDWQDENCDADRQTRLAPGIEPRFGCFNDADNPNPPDLDRFPDGPPLGARVGGRYQVVIGLGNDHVGYLVAPYDFQTDPALGALVRAPGHHYEETVSVGDVVDHIVDQVDQLTSLLAR